MSLFFGWPQKPFWTFYPFFNQQRLPVWKRRAEHRVTNKVIREIFKVTRWVSVRSQEKNSRGVIGKKQWVVSSNKDPSGQARVGQASRFLLELVTLRLSATLSPVTQCASLTSPVRWGGREGPQKPLVLPQFLPMEHQIDNHIVSLDWPSTTFLLLRVTIEFPIYVEETWPSYPVMIIGEQFT